MSLSIRSIGNIATKVARREIEIIKDSRRAGQLGHALYPNKPMMRTKMMLAKINKDVGPEAFIGTLLGTSTPIPGFAFVGYATGRVVAQCRKYLTRLFKNHKA